MLPPVYKSKDLKKERAGFQIINVNIVKVYNSEYEWFLLTNLQIESLNQLEEIIKTHKARWHIEDYFKILKQVIKSMKFIYIVDFLDLVEN